MQRHVDEPLISVQRAEDGERMHERMFLPGDLGLVSKVYDVDTLLLKPFPDLGAR